MLTLAVGPSLCAAAPASELLRTNLGDGGTGEIAFRADEIYSWQEGGKLVVALGGNVSITQEKDSIRAERAIVWVDIDNRKADSPTRGVIYAEGGVRSFLANEKQTAPAALVNFFTRGKMITDSKKPIDKNKSLKGSALYERARLALQPPIAPERLPPGIVLPLDREVSAPTPIVTADVRAPTDASSSRRM